MMQPTAGDAGRTGDRSEAMGTKSDEIFRDRSFSADEHQPLPDGPESDSSTPETTEVETKADETPAPAPTPAPKLEKKVQTRPNEEGEDDHVPDDLDGLKRALAAARGDKRKARTKWQDADRELAALKGKIELYERQLRAPQPVAATQTPKTVDIDEAGYFAGPAAVKEYIAAREKQQREEWEREAKEKLAPSIAQEVKEKLSEASARRRYSDFDAKFEAFKRNAPKHEFERAAQDADPYEYVYQYATMHEQMQGAQSLDDLKARWRQEWEAERSTTAEAEPEPQKQPVRPPVPPKSLAGARGSGASVTPQWTGPTAFDRLFASR